MRRVDLLLVERGLAESRHKAQALLLSGQVLVNEQKIEKPGRLVAADVSIRILEQLPFVGRGGIKLQAALDHFRIRVTDRVCADLGASTGGFTDCLLQKGAREVHAYDVGRGQLAWKLRSDQRVTIHDKFNVRNITEQNLPEEVSLVTMDLSFISVTKILPALKQALLNKGSSWRERPTDFVYDLVVLVKPQFEVGKGEVGKGGVVRSPEKQLAVLKSVEEFASAMGLCVVGSLPSPIPGAKGNQEFLLYLKLAPDLSS